MKEPGGPCVRFNGLMADAIGKGENRLSAEG